MDSQAEVSLIKISALSDDSIIDKDNIINIVGVTDGSVQSLGTHQTTIVAAGVEIDIEFVVVPNNFPIPVHGIIGKDFLKSHRCSLDYSTFNFIIRYEGQSIKIPIIDNSQESNYHRIPARCEVIKQFRLNSGITNDRIIRNTEIFPGVFIARAIVNPQKCFVRILNTTDNVIEIGKVLNIQSESLEKYNIIEFNTTNKNRDEILLKTLSKNMPANAPNSLINLCKSYSDIFAVPGDKHSVNNFYTQSLNLSDKNPVYIKNYRYPHTQKTEIEDQVNQMIKDKIIEPSCSSYNSPLILVPKRSINGEKKYRLCVDFRQLNKKLIPDKFPLPRIDEILDNLGKTTYFTILDLFSGFWQVPLDKKSKHLTSFSVGNKGQFQFNVLPFGLNVAPNSFARMMAVAFSGIDVTTAFLYLDDIIVIGNSEQHHLKNLEQVFIKCRERNLKLNPQKCEFMKREVVFLGHRCSNKGILPDDSKFEIIKKYPIPNSKDSVKRFVAFGNYYRKFIPNFAIITRPLNATTKKDTVFKWTEECQSAFEKIKYSLINPPILQYPDFSKQFVLTVDASKQGIGAVLSQINDEGHDLPISFASSGFSRADSNKPPIYQELLAIYFGIKHFRPYLFGTHFLVRSDHKPLSFLFSMKDPTSKFARIRSELTAYDFTIEYIKGKDNVAADALSRIDFNRIKSMSTETEQILVVTRAKAKQLAEQPLHLNTVETKKTRKPINNEHIRSIPLIVFNTNENSTELSFSIRGRHRIRSRNLSLDPQNVGETLSFLLAELDQVCLKKGLKEIRICNDDSLFELIATEQFSNIADEVLKNTFIWIMQSISEITTADQKLELLEHFHEHQMEGGHAGQKRLYSKLRSQFKWKGMAKDVAKYLKNCKKCHVNKPKVANKETLRVTETPSRPFQSVSIDTIGPFPTTTNQAKYAITIICEFSKYLIVTPIPNKESKTVARAFVNSLILVFGHVDRIRSDLGTEYVNQIMRDLTLNLGIHHDKSTAYHHESLGTVERSHRTLNEYLRCYMEENRDWPDLMKYFSYCYNTTPNSSINMYSPFEIVFGRMATNMMKNEIGENCDINEYVFSIRENLNLAFKKTNEFLRYGKQKSKIYYDKQSKPLVVSVGDRVLLVNEVRSKLDPLYKDEYIVKDIKEENVLIENNITHKTTLVHKNRLRLC